MSGKKITQFSPSSVNSELDLFEIEPTQTQIEDAVWEYIEATDFSERSNQLKFIIGEDERHFLDIGQTTLELDVCVKLANGDDLPGVLTDVKVYPADNFGHTIISKSNLSLNGVTLDYQDLYAEKAYMENLLNTSKEVKSSHLSVEGWMDDYAVGLDGDEFPPGAVAKRRGVVLDSRKRTYCMRPHVALMQQDKMIPPGTQLVLTLEKSSNKFALMAENSAPTGGGKVVITAARLRVRKCKLVDGAHVAIMRAWSGHLKSNGGGSKWGVPVNYNHKNAVVHRHTIPQNIRNKTITITNQRRPSRVFCAFTSDASAGGGDFKLNPFRFHHMNTDKVVLKIDGVPVDEIYEPDFAENGNSSKLYHALVSACGRQHFGSSNGVTEDEFVNGSTIFAWDLSRSLSNKLEKIYDVQLKFDFGFSDALADTVSIITYLEYDEHIQLTRGQPAVVT